MPLSIRTATAEDATAIAALIRILGYSLPSDEVPARLAEYSGQRSRVFLALSGESVVGFLSFHAMPMFHEAACLGRITAMAIDPKFHRQGIGRALVQAAEDFARECGCPRIEVTSGDHRAQDAHLFYQSQGYETDCRRFLKRLPLQAEI